MDNATTSKSLNNTANAIIQRGWWNQNLPKYSGARCGNAILKRSTSKGGN